MPKPRFQNIDNVPTDKTMKDFRQWRQERIMKKKDYSFRVPNVQPELEYLRHNRTDSTVTWIGHSTFLIQYAGLNIVTDPVWAMRMAMNRRLSPPGIPLRDMPPIDVILISHSHYDHLHISSVRRLYGADTIIVVPAGLRRKMMRKGFTRVVELQWWEQLQVRGVKIAFVPAQHWTRRTLTDTNRSHWGGFVLEFAGRRPVSEQQQLRIASFNPKETGGPEESGDGAGKEEKLPTIHFVGDTGYFRGFREIGERFDIDVSLMPIGAYEPEWFMTSQHVTPEEALQGFLESKAGLMIPMHYGAFKLADDTPREALDRLEAERRRLGIGSESIRVLAHGETLRL